MLFLKIITFFPEVVARYYSNGLYVCISHFLRNLIGSTSFSIGDILYTFLIIYIIYKAFTTRKSWRLNWKNNVLSILSGVSLFYFAFHLLWAMNYYRGPLFEKMNVQQAYTENDLQLFTTKLIAKTNAIQIQLTKNDTLKIDFPYTQNQVFKMNLYGYSKLATLYPFFEYSDLSVKKSLFSLPLSYMGFGGYLNPFTNEAQANYLVPMYTFPALTCHEMAHQMGYASESECNFIGFLASIKNKNLYFQYSGYSMALRYCLAILKIRNPEIFKQLIPTIHSGILKNFDESDSFWKQYETPIETGFKIFYDTYLKLNRQKEGLESYSKFVNFVVNYYKYKPL